VKVFLAGASLLPDYGGPAYSVSRLAHALADLGLDVGLWAPDRSAEASPLLPEDSRVRRLTGRPAEAVAAFGAPQVIHDNGIWLPHNHALAGLARRSDALRVVSTRGMLEPWAIRHKRWKKAIAWRVYQRGDLAGAQLHHATAPVEADNLRRLKLGVPVRTIPNGVDLPPAPAARRRSDKTRTALFLGRIYPVKGLPMLVEAWARARPSGWRLTIGGPDEAGHRADVERAVAAMGLQDVVSFAGPLDGAAKAQALQDADLLVLPSHSESFGMVVAEALAHELPVLTTSAVPWPELEARNCGWRVAPTADGLAEGLNVAAAQGGAALRAMGRRGRDLVAADFGWDQIARRFVDAYQAVGAPAAVVHPKEALRATP
jgi:glycosyltransferase involved in cell wall biosynthesis